MENKKISTIVTFVIFGIIFEFYLLFFGIIVSFSNFEMLPRVEKCLVGHCIIELYQKRSPIFSSTRARGKGPEE